MGPERTTHDGQARTPDVARLARLDGLRGIAACIVALYHVQALYPGGLGSVYGGVAGWIYQWGWTLVDLFFVISGYIFAHVYRGGAALTGKGQLADFGVARVARLYPLHLTLLLIVAVIDWGKPANTIGAFLAHLFMVQGLVPGAGAGFVSLTWSISIEMVCYGLFALAACSGDKTSARVSLLLFLFAAAMLAIKGLPGGPWNSDDLLRGIMGFFAGQLLWRHRGIARRLPTPLLVLALVAGLLIDSGRFSSLLPLGLLAWPAALLLALRLRIFEASPLLWLGDRSYAIYLIHYPVITILARIAGPLEPSAASLALTNVALAVIVLALSDLALRTIERPGRRVVRKAWADRRASPTPNPLPIRAEVD
jgi:peptidoglycan/LPS O-acetylase OafA/YrhL